MFAHGLQRVGHPEGVVVLQCDVVAPQQVVHLHLVDFLLCPVTDDSARADIVEVVEQLGVVAEDFPVGVDAVERLRRLLVETHIIIIGRSDDGQFGARIDHPFPLVLVERPLLLSDALVSTEGTLAIGVEILVMRLSLAKAHVLDVGNEQFHLIIGKRDNALELLLSHFVVHPHDTDERLVVVGFRFSPVVYVGRLQGLLGIEERGVEVAVMEVVRQAV